MATVEDSSPSTALSRSRGAAPVLDSYCSWMKCFCVVDFDLEYGQSRSICGNTTNFLIFH